jgi:hypothetical protein
MEPANCAEQRFTTNRQTWPGQNFCPMSDTHELFLVALKFLPAEEFEKMLVVGAETGTPLIELVLTWWRSWIGNN